MTSLQATLDHYQTRVNQALEKCLPPEHDEPTRLLAAMAYSVLGEGKRLRPVLVYATGQLLGAELAVLDKPACAVELIHAYSLIHDDLPAMDDDDLRRGKPTCHKAFDEATAILAGDTLQSLAFQILADDDHSPLTAAIHLNMVRTLADACGFLGMAGGQALDLWATQRIVSIADVELIHRRKTGALIHACIRLGAQAAGCTDLKILSTLDQFGLALGLAFQIQDDILDIEVETEQLGKPQGSDLAKQKATYPALLGLPAAKAKLLEVYTEALTALKQLPLENHLLLNLTNHIINRVS